MVLVKVITDPEEIKVGLSDAAGVLVKAPLPKVLVDYDRPGIVHVIKVVYTVS